MRRFALTLSMLLLFCVPASAQDFDCSTLPPNILDALGIDAEPDTVDAVCYFQLPMDVLRVRMVVLPAEEGFSDTLFFLPDSTLWDPGDGGSNIPPEDEWINHFWGGLRPGDYVYFFEGQPLKFLPGLGHSAAISAPGSGHHQLRRVQEPG